MTSQVRYQSIPNWRLISGEELDLIPTVSYAAGVPTCLIATYLIESRGLKTGVSSYSPFIKSKSIKTGEKLRKILLSHVIHWDELDFNTRIGEDWSLPHRLWRPPLLSLHISRHQFNGGNLFIIAIVVTIIRTNGNSNAYTQVPKYQQYWMAVVGQVTSSSTASSLIAISIITVVVTVIVIYHHHYHHHVIITMSSFVPLYMWQYGYHCHPHYQRIYKYQL